MSDKTSGRTNCEHEFHWYSVGCNETGWKCCSCDFKPGEPAGFDPNLDRDLIDLKVFGILHDLHDKDVIYVSNGSMGSGMEASVVRQCRDAGRYDQAFIVHRLTDPGDSTYWKDLGDAIRAGTDPRDRCWCGALATSVSIGGGKPRTCRCSDHYGVDNPQKPLPGVPF